MNMEWKKTASEPAYQGWRKIDRVTYELPTGITADFEIKQDGNAVCVLPLTTDNQVVMTKQYRPGPGKVLLELPGGGAHADEDFMEAMKRELLEETGYSGDLELVGASFVDAYSTAIRHHFIAHNCHKVAEPENNPREPIETALLSLEEFREHLRSGQLTDVATGYMALDHAGLL